MSFKTDKNRVLGLGTAGEGAGTWLRERITAVALIPLTIMFVCIVAPLIGGPYGDVIAAFKKPLNAIVVILFLGVTFKHLEDGLRVVIEDYVHGKGALVVLLIITKLGCWALGLASVFAVAKIAFS